MPVVKVPKPVGFDWNKHNRDKNWHKHKVDYKESEEIFFNKPINFFPDSKHSGQEKRFLALGRSKKNRLLAVVFTLRGKKIRIISARNQSIKERRKYEQK